MGTNKFLLTILLFVITSSIVCGQIDEKKIMKKWKAVEIISLAIDIDNPNSNFTSEEAKKMLLQTVFDFKQDHTFNGSMFLEEMESASWKMENNRVYVFVQEISRKGLRLELKIVELKDDYIIVSIVDDGVILMTFKMK
jgi:hypothetical protein